MLVTPIGPKPSHLAQPRFNGVRIIEEENGRFDFEVYNDQHFTGIAYGNQIAPSCQAATILSNLRAKNQLFDKARQYPNWIKKLITQVIAHAPNMGLAQKFRLICLVSDVHREKNGPYVGNTTENADPYGQPTTYLAYSPVTKKSGN